MNRTKSQTFVHIRQLKHPRSLSAVLVAGAMLVIATATSAQVFSTPIEISGGGPGGLPLIAVDSNNNIDVAWAASQSVVFTRSTDGGKNFTAPVTISTGTGGNNLQMNVDSAGGIYLLWQRSDLHFLLSHSADGRSFATSVDLTAGLAMGTFSGSLPRMALDANGNVDLVWAQFGATGAVLFSRSSDGGASFSTAVQLGTFVYGARAQIATAASGQIYVLWTEETTQAGGTCVLRFNRSSDSGSSFSPALTLNNPDGECDARLELDASGGLNVLSFDGNGTYYHSMDGGKTFSTSPNIFLPTTIWFGGQLNSSAGGTINTVLNSFPNHDVLFSKSANHGTSFSAPILVSASHPAPSPSGAFGGNNQLMSVDAAGNINVIWADDILNPGAPDIFSSRSTDGGAHFSAAQNLSSHPGAGSPAMAQDAAGGLDVVWAADNASKVFFSRAAVSASSGFTISGASARIITVPGGTATAQVTLTADSGFNQVVSLSCGNLPPGAQCTFNPASVTPGITGTTIGVSVTVPATLPINSFPFTVNAFTPTISQFLNMQITVGVLTGSVSPSATIIPLGGSANFAVTIVSTGNFAGQFTLGCNAPNGVTCKFTPNSGFLPINGRAAATLNVQIASLPAAGSAPKNPGDIQVFGPPNILSMFVFTLFVLCAAAFWVAGTGKRLRLIVLRTAASMALTIGLAACLLSCGAVSKNRIGSATATGTSGATEQGPSGSGATATEGGSGTSSSSNGGVTATTSVTFPLTVVAQSGGAVENVGTVSVTVP